MRIAVVSDIHSNLAALTAVLGDVPPDVEQIWCLGDVVNYHAHPRECLTLLRGDPRTDIACWLMGNHDAAVIGLVEAAQLNQYGQATLAYTRAQLSSADRAFLRDSLGGPGCTLCALALRSMRRYFETLGYDSVNDPGIRNAVRAARGFCEVHGRMLREARDALGTAIIHRDVLTTLADALGGTAYRGSSLGDLLRQAIGGEAGAKANGRADALAPQEPCPACGRRQMTDQLYIDVLMQHLTEDALLPQFRRSARSGVPAHPVHARSAAGRHHRQLRLRSRPGPV